MRALFKFAKILLACVGALLVLVTCTPVVRWWTLELARPWNEARGDVLIVLEGNTTGRGMIGESSYWRSVYAVWAWQQGGFQKLILSGGAEGTGEMRRFLISQGIPANSIMVESQSRSTRENACNTGLLLKKENGKPVLLTSDYHAFRAYRAFRKCGVDVTSSPLSDALKRQENWWLRWPVFGELAMETAKIGYYAVRGWI